MPEAEGRETAHLATTDTGFLSVWRGRWRGNAGRSEWPCVQTLLLWEPADKDGIIGVNIFESRRDEGWRVV